MTRKHYILIAAALADSRPDVEDYTSHSAIGNNTMVNGIAHEAALAAWSNARNRVANALLETNVAFDYRRFIAATEA